MELFVHHVTELMRDNKHTLLEEYEVRMYFGILKKKRLNSDSYYYIIRGIWLTGKMSICVKHILNTFLTNKKSTRVLTYTFYICKTCAIFNIC